MEKGPSVISRGFQLKHIPSGAVRPCSFVCVCVEMNHVQHNVHIKILLKEFFLCFVYLPTLTILENER